MSDVLAFCVFALIVLIKISQILEGLENVNPSLSHSKGKQIQTRTLTKATLEKRPPIIIIIIIILILV